MFLYPKCRIANFVIYEKENIMDQAWQDYLDGKITFLEYSKRCQTAAEGQVNANSGVQTINTKNAKHQNMNQKPATTVAATPKKP